MSIITKQRFEEIARNKTADGVLSTQPSTTRKFLKFSSASSIFLSHAHTDRALVEQAKIFLENLGISLYIDWADETMPERPSGITALKIKQQIHANDKFILMATNAAIVSKWCNWELGIGDTIKLASDKLCLLPLADSKESWAGNEYLQIYPRIEEGEFIPDSYKIIYPDSKTESFRDWLKQ